MSGPFLEVTGVRATGADNPKRARCLRNWQLGLLVSFAALLVGAAFLVLSNYRYTGTCGESLLPFLGEQPHPCGRGEYLEEVYWPALGFLFSAVMAEFWHVILAVFLVPALIGGFLDLRKGALTPPP